MFDYKCAVINREDYLQIMKGVFRISRGNAWVHVLEIIEEDVNTLFKKGYEFLKEKQICVIIYQRGEENILGNKLSRFFSCL